MIILSFLLGLVVGVVGCEILGRHAYGYSVVTDAVSWIKGWGL